MDDFRLKDLRVQIDPQSGADSNVIAADIAAEPKDVAVKVDIGGIIQIVAGRPQPPTAVALGVSDKHSTSIRILGRFTLSCAIGAEVLICFGNA